MCSLLGAQSLSVESFRLLENDLTANTYGTMERDQNGEVAALIRVVTPETGFAFDAGMLGIVKTTQKIGEIWVYVPYGLQRITIFHQELGVIRDYYFPVPIEKARSYEMVLKSERKREEPAPAPQPITVTFNIPLSNATLYVNGISMGNGSMKVRMLTLTDYNVEVKKEGYNTYTTSLNFNPEDDGKVINVTMEPITGTLKVNSQPEGANVYLSGSLVGTTPFTRDNLPYGVTLLDVRKKGYRPYNSMVRVSDRTTYTVDVTLDEIKYLGKSGFYMGAAYQIGHITAIIGYAGLYLHNINIEGGYIIPQVETERTRWVTSPDAWTGNTMQFVYDYKIAQSFSGCVGYGLHLGKRLRITPQVGAIYRKLEGTLTDSNVSGLYTVTEDDEKSSTWVISGFGAARIELSPVNHITLAVTPQYEMPLSMGSLANTINGNTNIVKQWCVGFALKAGLEIYF